MLELLRWVVGWPLTPGLVVLTLLLDGPARRVAWVALAVLGVGLSPEPVLSGAALSGALVGLALGRRPERGLAEGVSVAAALLGASLLDGSTLQGGGLRAQLLLVVLGPVLPWALAAGASIGRAASKDPWALLPALALFLAAMNAGQGKVAEVAVPAALLLGAPLAWWGRPRLAIPVAAAWLGGTIAFGPRAAGPYDNPPELLRRPAADLEVLLSDGAMISSLDVCPDGTVVFGELASGRVQRLDPTDGSVSLLGRVSLPAIEGDRDSYELGLWGLACDPEDGAVFALAVHRWDEADPDPAARSSRLLRIEPDGATVTLRAGIPAGPIHAGGALRFGPDGWLYASVGDGLRFGTRGTLRPQDLPPEVGAILRLDRSGGPAGSEAVFARGFRNVYGLAFDEDGALWATENGPDCCDALLRVEPGGVYGWPPGGGAAAPAWSSGAQRLGPTGLARLSARYGPLEGDLVFATWHTGALHRVRTAGGRIVQHEIVSEVPTGRPPPGRYGFAGAFTGLAVAPDGMLWFSTLNAVGRVRSVSPP